MDTNDTSAAPAEGAENPGTEEIEMPTPVEGEGVAAPAEGEAAPAEVVEKTPEELAAEEAAKAEADAKFLAELPELLKRIPEAEQRRLGQKYANGTMAAARRAERAAERLTSENASLKAQIETSKASPSLRDDPAGAMKAAGFNTAREFIDYLVTKGAGNEKKPDALDEVSKLRKEIEDRKAADLERENAAKVEASKQAVAGALKAQGDKYARVSTSIGQSRLWEEIATYQQAHGNCPDAAVFYLADAVERELRAEFGEPAPRSAAKVGSAPAQGAPGTSARAKATTINSKGSSGAPVVREYSLDLDERRAQVNADMLAAGELRRGEAQG